MSDVVMPGKDGLARSKSEVADIATPVVMMSGQAHIDMAVSYEAGCADFLEKPISTEKRFADSRGRA
jgi:FixJ family two-component response regulator